jgi:hypothetical protein
MKTDKEVQASIQAMERKLFATDDAEIEQVAEEVATEEKAIVQESTDVKLDGDVLGQNERAMQNWPIEARQKVAKSLVALAKSILEE